MAKLLIIVMIIILVPVVVLSRPTKAGEEGELKQKRRYDIDCELPVLDSHSKRVAMMKDIEHMINSTAYPERYSSATWYVDAQRTLPKFEFDTDHMAIQLFTQEWKWKNEFMTDLLFCDDDSRRCESISPSVYLSAEVIPDILESSVYVDTNQEICAVFGLPTRDAITSAEKLNPGFKAFMYDHQDYLHAPKPILNTLEGADCNEEKYYLCNLEV